MKITAFLCLCLCIAKLSAADYTPKVSGAIAQLVSASTEVRSFADEKKKWTEERFLVGGCSVGYAGRPGAFFLLMPYFDTFATESDVSLMMKKRVKR